VCAAESACNHVDGAICCHTASIQRDDAGGDFQEWFRLNGEWMAMPAFTFEKISPPARRTPNAPAEKKRRSVVGQVLDRISGTRGKPASREEQNAPARREFKV
jgi:hypothetical protein